MAILYKPACNAIAQGDSVALRKEIRERPDVVEHWKPLCDAAFEGDVSCIEILLDAGADPNQKARVASNHTPLTRITQHHRTIPKHEGHSRSLALLLERGADSRVAAGPLNLVPMVYATMGPQQGFIDVLNDHSDPSDPFIAAALNNVDQLVAEWKASSQGQLLDEENRTPVHYTGISGMWRTLGGSPSIECAKFILEQGYDIDHEQPIPEGDEVFGATALRYAVAHSENAELAEYLLERGSDPNRVGFAATFNGDLDMVELLDRFGMDWNWTFEGSTPLLDLLNFRKPKLVPWLLEHGADINARDPHGRTALHLAAIRGVRTDYLEVLVKFGADPSATDNNGETPLDSARRAGKSKAAALLESIN